MFATDIDNILHQIDLINPVKYAKTRNFVDGAVTKLSPYISRGVISTKQVLDAVVAKGYKLYQIEKFVQELAWRDYYQQVWIAKENYIDKDLKNAQPNILYNTIPEAIVNATTGINAIDYGIKELYATGYMHNHVRMYIASVVCNVGKCHWLVPAQWMYHHLKDADWASNALSWQWTAAAFSSKKYYANQENINKYCNTKDVNTFLNVPYEAFENMEVPEVLQKQTACCSTTNLPQQIELNIDSNVPTLIYNFYNLDYNWKKEIVANRILLLEPSFFAKYTSSENVMQFIFALAKNIGPLQIFVGEFADLEKNYNLNNIFYKEHPTNKHYKGTQESREWLVPNVTGYYNSFFSYWKKISIQLKKQYV